jgi:uncharacterized protein YndB with AHSA1/START domain
MTKPEPALERIDRTIDIDAPPERVWRALADPSELSAWFQVTIEGVLAPGAELWMTARHTGYEGQRFRVRILEMTPPRRLAWQWHPGEVDPAVDYARESMTTVTFTLEPMGRGTRLSVAETGFDQVSIARRAKVYRDNEGGWAEVLGWLRTYAEGAR